MAEKIQTFDQATQDHEGLIGSASGDLWKDGGLFSTMPVNRWSALHAQNDTGTPATSRNWWIKPRCPCYCRCQVMHDIDLGTITVDLDDSGVPYTTSEDYTRVSLFDHLDSVDTFGAAANEYVAYYVSILQNDGTCLHQVVLGFTENASGVGVGSGTNLGVSNATWSNANGRQLEYLEYDDILSSWDDASSYHDAFLEPDTPYPNAQVFGGNWDYDDGTVSITFTFGQVAAIDGTRPYAGETLPAGPNYAGP